ncbi:MAG TPA: hypothetical protein VGF95_02560 [Solirubrobacteraceae bacterium]|jgi:hypothetical protein
MKESKMKAKLAIGVVLAAGLAISPAAATAAKSKRYLKHPGKPCAKHYVKKTEKVKKRKDGKKVKVKETLCVYVAPKAPVSPATKPAAIITTPSPTQTVTTLSIKRSPQELFKKELGKEGCWNLTSLKEDLSVVSGLEGSVGEGGLGGLEGGLEGLEAEEEVLEKDLKGITAELCFYEAEAQVKTPGGAAIAGATTLDFTNGLEAGRQWILPASGRLPLVELTVNVGEHTLTALVSMELGSLVAEVLTKFPIAELEEGLEGVVVPPEGGEGGEGEVVAPEVNLAKEAALVLGAIPAIPIVGMSDGTGPFTGSGGWTVSAKYAGSTEFSASESAPTPIH